MSDCTQVSFLHDVSDHHMEIIRDEGVYRHVRFKRQDSWSYRYDLITWPDHLCITGDMGTYVFSRVDDMFEFFRGATSSPDKISINTNYWAEKLLSGSHVEFSIDLFEQAIKDDFEMMFEGSDEEDVEEAWGQVQQEIFDCMDETDHAGCIKLATEFELDDGMRPFQDFYEHTLTRPTYRYVWCCYALVWGIRMYDSEVAK